jgi:exopolysaccharide production protein ExoQ
VEGRSWSNPLRSCAVKEAVVEDVVPAPAAFQSTPHVDRRMVGLAAAGLLITTGGPSTGVALHLIEGQNGEGAPVFVYPFAAVAIVSAVLLGRTLLSTNVRLWPYPIWFVGLYAGWASLSTLWSVDQASTFRAALIGIGIVAFGCWLGWMLTFDEQVWSVVIATSLATVSSAIVIVLAPSAGKMPPRGNNPGGEFQGIFGNRNSLAPVCVLALLGLAAFVARSPTTRRIAAAVLLALVDLILLKGSGGLTSMLALVLIVGTIGLLVVLRSVSRAGVPGRTVAAITGTGVLGGALVLFANLDSLVTKVGRDPTLSRRRWIWDDVRGIIQQRPWRGYGFHAFWNRPDLTAATYARHGSEYASAHNSVLEVTLGLGVIGLITYLAIGLAMIAGLCAWVWQRPGLASWWWALLAMFIVTQNLMESFVLWHSYLWVLFVAAALAPFGRSASET